MNALKNFDVSFFSKKIKFIAGVDEAGRGPLCGPVIAASVIFNKNIFHPLINDSKKIPEKKREELFNWIIENCICYGIGIVDNNKIDEINILQATLLAMQNAISSLSTMPDLILIDGNKSFTSQIPVQTVVKGDTKSFSIAAASILAKVTRDRIMNDYDSQFSVYNWKQNKGYATKQHIAAIKKFGKTPLHRNSFLNKILPEIQQEFSFKR